MMMAGIGCAVLGWLENFKRAILNGARFNQIKGRLQIGGLRHMQTAFGV